MYLGECFITTQCERIKNCDENSKLFHYFWKKSKKKNFIASSLENFCFQRERQSFLFLWNETEGLSYDTLAFKIDLSFIIP